METGVQVPCRKAVGLHVDVQLVHTRFCVTAQAVVSYWSERQFVHGTQVGLEVSVQVPTR